MKTFDPARIAARRKKLRKTQQDLARETGLSSTAIFYIEKGRKVPRATTLGRIADALRCRVEYFFADSNNNR
ncbi:MAG: helix-turn-helix domain-containing protein [Nitrospirae bacterium]|nr:helix-turn-helix domain-containing protein [Nitrospirota bacterium]